MSFTPSRFLSGLLLAALFMNLLVLPAHAEGEEVLPDLIVSSATLGSDNSLNFVVSNTGLGNVDTALFPDLNFIFDFTSADLSDSTTVVIPIDDAGGADYRTAGLSSTIVLPTESEAPGCTMYFLLVADGNGEVTESDETNNEYRGSFDFCTTDSGIDLYTENNDTIHDLIMDFEVGNQGDTSVPLSFIDDDLGTNYFYLDGVYVRQARWFWHTAGSYIYTAAGGLQIRYFPFYYIPSLSTMSFGTHTAMHCIDATGVVSELDETNNCDTTTFELTELPDLYSLVNQYNTSSNTVDFTLGNVSNVSVLNWYGNYTVSMNGVVALTQDWFTDSDSSYVNALTSRSLSYTFDPELLVEGTNTIEVCMDQAYNIAESDEENNCSSFEFSTLVEETPDTGDSTDSVSSTDSSNTSGGGGVVPNSHHSSSSSTTGSEGSQDVTLSSDDTSECAPMTFTDVTADTVGYDAILQLWCMGVVHGRDSAHFVPEDSIKRDEVSKIVARLFGYVTVAPEALPVPTEAYFTDMSLMEALVYYVQDLTDEGFYAAEKTAAVFRPHDYMTAAEIADLLTQATGKTVTEEDVAAYKGGDTMSRGSFAALVVSL